MTILESDTQRHIYKEKVKDSFYNEFVSQSIINMFASFWVWQGGWGGLSEWGLIKPCFDMYDNGCYFWRSGQKAKLEFRAAKATPFPLLEKKQTDHKWSGTEGISGSSSGTFCRPFLSSPVICWPPTSDWLWTDNFTADYRNDDAPITRSASRPTGAGNRLG